MATKQSTEPINLFDRTDSGSSGDDGTDTGSSPGNDTAGTGSQEGSTEQDQSPTSFFSLDDAPTSEQHIVIEAPQVRRRGRRSRLNTSGETTDKPLQSPSKRAEKYIKKLQMLWYKMHGLLGAVIDDHLRWTIDESQLFAEAAYDVFAERGWLKFLDKANEAYLLVIVMEIEISKVKAMLQAQRAAPKNKPVGPPPTLKAVQTDKEPTGNGVPSFVVAPHDVLDGIQ